MFYTGYPYYCCIPYPLLKVNITQLFVPVLKNAFTAFDHEKKGVLGTEMIGIIIELLGHSLQPSELDNIIREVDADGECV